MCVNKHRVYLCHFLQIVNCELSSLATIYVADNTSISATALRYIDDPNCDKAELLETVSVSFTYVHSLLWFVQ